MECTISKKKTADGHRYYYCGAHDWNYRSDKKLCVHLDQLKRQ